MKKWIVFISLSFCVILAFAGCTTPTQPSNGNTSNANCVITGESTTLSRNENTRQYEYDSQGMPSKVTTYGPYGSVISTANIYYDGVTTTSPGQYNNSVNSNEMTFDADLFSKKLPSKARISLTLDGVTQVDYIQYLFSYDAQDRLIKIVSPTATVGDQEMVLNIFYDDNNNVTELRYGWSTGPNNDVTSIKVSAYDDKPTPYASISFWKFLMINFSWTNYDPEPVLTALSQNNPLDYTFGTYSRTMSYQYNESGFPVERSNTNTSSTSNPPGATYTFTQSFSYNCK